jgi:hypothetical protein
VRERERLDALMAVVAEAIPLVVNSVHEGWGQHRATSELVDDLQGHLVSIGQGDISEVSELRILFAPTGTLQELSLANDWSDRYLALAKRFDAATG